jgi:hypothetical protein
MLALAEVSGLNAYAERLMKMIPGEAVGLYLVGAGVLDPAEGPALALWTTVCLAAVIVVRVYGTADHALAEPADWRHVTISAVAFLVWIYSIGGPFAAYGVASPRVGALLVLVVTFFAPYVYRGPAA